MFLFSMTIVWVFTAARSSAYTVPIQTKSEWWQDSVHHFHGYCEFQVNKTYNKEQVTVEMILNTPTDNIQIWKLKVATKNSDGTVYELYNPEDIHEGLQTVDFILEYSTSNIPSGWCVTNLPSPGQTTSTSSPTTSTTTTTPSTTTPTTTTLSTTTPSTTTSSTAGTQTTQSTGNDVYQVPVVKVEGPWGGGSSWGFKAKCSFDVTSSWQSGTFLVDLNLNQETSNMQIWRMNVLSNTDDGFLYKLANKYWVSKGLFEFSFIVSYTGDESSYPRGYCRSNIPLTGSTSSTSSSSTTTQSTTTTSGSTSTTSRSTTTTPSGSTTTPSTTTQTSSTTATSGGTTSATSTQSPPVTAHNYGLILEKSILFYEAQQSGSLLPDHRIDWRGDSALGDSGIHGENLTGGWYDAGDGVKFNLPMSASVVNLAVGLIKWGDAYNASGQLQHMFNSLQWPLDYFLKCWRSGSQIYYVQVGNGDIDHSFWTRPEDMTMSRPAYFLNTTKRGSDVAGGTAAALAAGSIAFLNKDPSYASTLLANAESLYAFAKAHPGTYNNDIPEGAKFYQSSEYRDEMCVSAALLYKATDNQQYLSDAVAFYNSYGHSGWAYDWDDKTMLCDVLLYEITEETKYKTAVENFITSYMPGGSVPYTPCGLAWRLKWGPLRYSANAAFIALLAADVGIGNAVTYKEWAMSQIHYMLGDNGNDFSYVVGYGTNYTLRPHHRSSSCDPDSICDWNDFNRDGPNPHVLEGALVGGPGLNGVYEDERDNYETNEVACDYNAGFQSAVAGLLHFAVTGNLPAAPSPSC